MTSLREVISRLGSIIASFERIYNIKLDYASGFVKFKRLRATENLLELEKLAIVLKKTIYENYNIPIITIETKEADYIIDGHHRAYAKYLLCTMFNPVVSIVPVFLSEPYVYCKF